MKEEETIAKMLKAIEAFSVELGKALEQNDQSKIKEFLTDLRRQNYRLSIKAKREGAEDIVQKTNKIAAEIKSINDNLNEPKKCLIYNGVIFRLSSTKPEDIYKKASEWINVFTDLISALHNLYTKLSAFPKGPQPKLTVSEFEDFSQGYHKAIISQCSKAAEDLHKVAMNIHLRGKVVPEENAIVALSAPLIFLDNWLGKTLKNTLLKVTYKLEKKNPLFKFIEDLIIDIDKIIESFEPVLKECKALLKILGSESRAETRAYIHFIKPLEQLLAHTR